LPDSQSNSLSEPTMVQARPQSAPPIFATSGVTARPAGVAGILGSTHKAGLSNMKEAFVYGSSATKGMKLREHALRRHSQYAVITPDGWMAKEASVRPTAQSTASGVVSAGSIDNTYVAAPLANRWGKAREKAKKRGLRAAAQAGDGSTDRCKGRFDATARAGSLGYGLCPPALFAHYSALPSDRPTASGVGIHSLTKHHPWRTARAAVGAPRSRSDTHDT